jgi:hypothetical protein
VPMVRSIDGVLIVYWSFVLLFLNFSGWSHVASEHYLTIKFSKFYSSKLLLWKSRNFHILSHIP